MQWTDLAQMCFKYALLSCKNYLTVIIYTGLNQLVLEIGLQMWKNITAESQLFKML